jgi:SAM-dependent methyltransferase
MGLDGLSQRIGRLAGAALTVVARSGLWLLRHLPLGERAEHWLLQRTWGTGSAEMLDAYLVSGYQNPRINLQSVLERHFLVARVFGGGEASLMEQEVRFAIELNEVLRRRASELGVKMGTYRNPIKHAAVRRVDAAIAGRERDMLERWSARLPDAPAGERLKLIEFACGSANDYRAFAEAGLAPHVDYLGIDLSEKNVANARRRHPEARFEVGDILDLPYADRAFDYVIAADIFEHLSLDAMERALDEAARLAGEGMVLTFFNTADASRHEIRRRRAYHWNRLSRPLIVDRLRAQGFEAITAVPIARWLRRTHGYEHSYNRHAWTVFAEREPRVAALLPHRFEEARR